LFDAVLAKVVAGSGGSIKVINSARAVKLEALRDSKQIEALRKKLRGEGVANDGLLTSSLSSSASTSSSSSSSSSPSPSSANSASSGGGPTGAKPSKAAEDKEAVFRSIVKVFADSNIRPNTRSFNTLLKALRGSGEGSFQRCMELVESMRKLGLQPDSVTVNTLVDASVMDGKFEAAEQVSDRILMDGLS
jgi:uncharacterized protein YqgV (UPF0045/DUF77 family)